MLSQAAVAAKVPSWGTHMHCVDEVSQQALPQLLVAAGSVKHQVGHVCGAVTRQKRAAEVSDVWVADALRPKAISSPLKCALKKNPSQ